MGEILHSNPRTLALVNSLVLGTNAPTGRVPSIASQPWQVFGVSCLQTVGAWLSMKDLGSGRE